MVVLLALVLSVLIPFELTFMSGVRQGYDFVLLNADPQLSCHFAEGIIHLLH